MILQNLKFPDRSGPGTVRNFVCIGRNESQWKAYIGNQDFKSFQESNNERKISFFFILLFSLLQKSSVLFKIYLNIFLFFTLLKISFCVRFLKFLIPYFRYEEFPKIPNSHLCYQK